MSIPDVVIVGGGVIGLTTAYYLAADGVRVTVVDAGEMGRQASWAGAGILPAPGDAATTPLETLRNHSLRLYPGLSSALRDETGIDNGYRVCGGLELPGPGQRPSDVPTEEWHTPGAECEWLSHWLVREATQGLVTAPFAAWLPTMAQVRNPWHVQALEAACVLRGVTLLPGWPVRSVRSGGVEGERGRLTAGRVVVAGGAWTGRLLEPLGVRLAVRPVRGQMLLLGPSGGGMIPVIVKGKRYVVTRGDGRRLIGSTEEEAGFDVATTADGLADLRAFAAEVSPRLAEQPEERAWAGLRPASADGVPYVGEVPGHAGVWVAAGHFRAGLLLSPGTGLCLAARLQGREPAVPLGAFGMERLEAAGAGA